MNSGKYEPLPFSIKAWNLLKHLEMWRVVNCASRPTLNIEELEVPDRHAGAGVLGSANVMQALGEQGRGGILTIESLTRVWRKYRGTFLIAPALSPRRPRSCVCLPAAAPIVSSLPERHASTSWGAGGQEGMQLSPDHREFHPRLAKVGGNVVVVFHCGVVDTVFARTIA